MPAFTDERLIDPRPEDLVCLLRKATKGANGRLRKRRVEKNEDSWWRFFQWAQKKPEGRQRYGRGSDGAQVRVAWWTDHVGRRHWRVIGRRVDWADRLDR